MEKIIQRFQFGYIFNYLPLMKELVKRDLKIKYRRSFLGYLWSLLNPLLMMSVWNYVFSTIFLNTIPNFLLYLICGNTLWSFFSESTTMAMYSVLQNSTLIKKIYVPKFIFPFSRVVSSFVTMSFSLMAILIVMILTKATYYWTILLIWIPLGFLFLFCCGLGMILSALSVYFRDITHLYGVLTLAWMYATPVFYDVSILPADVQNTLSYNPMYYFITFFRSLIMYGEIPGAETWRGCIVSCVLSFAVGMFVFRKLQKNFILYI